MKKVLVVALAVCSILALTGISQAVEPKVGILYELADNSPLEIAGSAVITDLNGIKNLDVDAFIGNDLGQIENNDNVTILTGLSYNYDVSDNIALGVGVAVGTKRFEKLRDPGETKYGVYASTTVKF